MHVSVWATTRCWVNTTHFTIVLVARRTPFLRLFDVILFCVTAAMSVLVLLALGALASGTFESKSTVDVSTLYFLQAARYLPRLRRRYLKIVRCYFPSFCRCRFFLPGRGFQDLPWLI